MIDNKYVIYHIPGKKIGVTNDLYNRVECQQGYEVGEYEILESSNDINYISKREIELQKEYWPEAKRKFQPIDIEYLSCECRKYYSYVNGTKLFEGKNVFNPKA